MPTPRLGLPKVGERWRFIADKTIVVEIVSRRGNDRLAYCRVRDISTSREWNLGAAHFARINHQWEFIPGGRYAGTSISPRKDKKTEART